MCFYSKKRQFFLLPLIALEADRCRENQVTKWSWGLWGYMLTESRNFWISYQSSVKQFGTLFASQTLLNTSPFLGMRQLCSITQFLFSHKKKIGQVHKFREKTTKKRKLHFGILFYQLVFLVVSYSYQIHNWIVVDTFWRSRKKEGVIFLEKKKSRINFPSILELCVKGMRKDINPIKKRSS